jgi:hypothetical protein
MVVKVREVLAMSDDENVTHESCPKVGVAFINQDQSIDIVIDCFPRTGKMRIMSDQEVGEKKEEKRQ